LLDASAIAERLRWQLDGWLSGTGRGPARPTAGILRLRLVPDGVLEHAGFQLGLWGDAGQQRDRAHRALTRVQGMLGPDAVLTAVLGGGRDPGDQVRLVPCGDERLPTRPGPPAASAPPGKAEPLGDSIPPVAARPATNAPPGKTAPPWPGRMPAPSPATVPPEPLPATVLDRSGEPVRVNARLAMTGAPHGLVLGRDRVVEITGWAGPWPVEERWWAPGEPDRRVRFQVCLADGRAMLLSLSNGCWWVIGVYD
jgi:protein ImuB